MTALPLATTDLGSGNGPPLVILHGLFGRRRNWQAIQKQLARKHRVITADLRNHGDSPWDDDMTYPAMASDIGKLVQDLDAGPAIVVGHSMGGKAAMSLALSNPDIIASLVVIDIAPVPYDHDYSGYIEAMKSVPLDKTERRADAESFLTGEVEDPGIRNFLLQNLETTDGGLAWRVNLDVIDKAMPTALEFPPADGKSFDGKALFIAGGKSDYIKHENRDVISALFPQARHIKIKDAGHWVHAEKPQEIVATLESVAAHAAD